MTNRSLQESFYHDGYIVLKNALSDQETAFYRDKIIALDSHGSDNEESSTYPNGVVNNKDLWNIFFNKQILQKLKEVFDNDDIKFCQHNDIHNGYSGSVWHRDSVNRKFGVGPNWDEAENKYQLARIGIYFEKFSVSNFKLGVIPGSHRRESLLYKIEKNIRILLSIKSLKRTFAKINWIPLESGDCILFDPRLLHAGGWIKGPKQSIFFAYGIANKHFQDHQNYYKYVRKDLNYEELPDELIERLREHKLFAENAEAYNTIEDAYIPELNN